MEKERNTKRGKRSVCKQKKGGERTQGAEVLFPEGDISRRSGSKVPG